MKEQWLEVEILTSEEASEAVADLLVREGASGVATEDPDEIRRIIDDPDTLIFTDPSFREGLPDYVRIRGYFNHSEAGVQAPEFEVSLKEKFLAMGEFLDLGRADFKVKLVEDSDWADNWKQYYHPLRVSPHLTVCPSWEPYQAGENEHVITLDPASAFGTGEHATTALCMACLDQLRELGPLPEPILDLGCGSGILAIAAAFLGAEDVTAADIDPNACRVARENFERNGLAGRINCHAAGIDRFVEEIRAQRRPAFRLILANILAEVHMNLLDDYLCALSVDGQMILSGIIDHKAAALEQALREKGFEIVRREQREDWVMLLVRRT